jgi:MFS family permease
MLFGVFFLIPFTLVRVYHESGFAAGLRLSLVPVMLGLLAPLGGVLFDRVGPRLATTTGMLLCLAGLALLYLYLDGTTAHLPLVMTGLAVFGAGQGLFVSPNTSAIMATAPPALTGEAGSLLNVVRFLGISGGIASASTVLALSLSLLYGDRHGTLGADPQSLVDSGRLVLLMLGGFGALAGLLSLLRSVPRDAKAAGSGTPVEIG